MIDSKTAAAAAKKAMAASHGPSMRTLEETAGKGDIGAPLLVERLDAVGRAYYLVPWESAEGVTAVVQIDAVTGEMASAAALPAPVSHLVMSPRDAEAHAAAEFESVGAAHLVWRPCRETISPLQPLYEVPVKGGVVYVATGGSVHRHLTDLGRGG